MKHTNSSRFWKILTVAAIGVSATAVAWLVNNLMSAYISPRPASAASMPQAVAARDARAGHERMVSAVLPNVRATFVPHDLAAARGVIRHHTGKEIAL